MAVVVIPAESLGYGWWAALMHQYIGSRFAANQVDIAWNGGVILGNSNHSNEDDKVGDEFRLE